jgi:hypothetical protein
MVSRSDTPLRLIYAHVTGSGGLAGQYRFGARSGSSVQILGLFKIAIGLMFGSSLTGLLERFPKSLLGIMVSSSVLTRSVCPLLCLNHRSGICCGNGACLGRRKSEHDGTRCFKSGT